MTLLLLLLPGFAAAAGEDSDSPLMPMHQGHSGAIHNPAAAATAAAAAAAASAQLSVLRAELSASDAELVHVRSHLAIVLQQLGAAAGAGNVVAAVAAAAGGGGQHVAQSELDFLREVRHTGHVVCGGCLGMFDCGLAVLRVFCELQ
jgi:transcriptional regulator GlxA family with amidase domain